LAWNFEGILFFSKEKKIFQATEIVLKISAAQNGREKID
jgi:hypothetical protein